VCVCVCLCDIEVSKKKKKKKKKKLSTLGEGFGQVYAANAQRDVAHLAESVNVSRGLR